MYIQLSKDEVVTNRSYQVCKKCYLALEFSNVILKRSFPARFYFLSFSLVDKLQDAWYLVLQDAWYSRHFLSCRFSKDNCVQYGSRRISFYMTYVLRTHSSYDYLFELLFCWQDAGSKARMMLSWDVNNGVSILFKHIFSPTSLCVFSQEVCISTWLLKELFKETYL